MIQDPNEKTSWLPNYLTLLAKYFIFKNKCQESIPTMIHFKAYFKEKQKVEKLIANINKSRH